MQALKWGVALFLLTTAAWATPNCVNDLSAPKLYRVLSGGQMVLSTVPGRYAGWTQGKIFGRLDCKSGQRFMHAKNRIFFATWEDAITAGYRPCKKCRPTPLDRY